MMLRMKTWLQAALVLLVVAPTLAFAQAYPNKPVKVVVPFAAGSVSDAVSRFIAEQLSKSMGVAFVVENKGGASGIIGAEAVAHAAPDGYTLMITSNTTQAANLSLFKKLPYDPLKDFTAIARIGYYPFVLVINPEVPAKNVKEFLAYAKVNPGKLSYATSNSMSLVSAEQIKLMANLDIVGVPYKANSQAITDLISGQVQVMIADLGTTRPHIKAGKLRALGVTPGKPTPLLPDVPPLGQAGLPGFDMVGWVGMFAPANLPSDIAARISKELLAILTRKDNVDRLADIGCEIVPSSQQEMTEFSRREVTVWTNRIKAVGIQPE